MVARKRQGEWIANCKSTRVQRIAAASVFELQVGRPRPNQMQTLEDLEAEGMVGLYRVGEKVAAAVRRDQEAYLRSNDFLPTPEVLRSFAGLPSNRGGQQN